jgi:transcriptional regulator with XRE-family HTH domain
MALGQEELGRRIAQARREAGLTQPELAALAGLKHPQSISNYERGSTEVPPRRLRRIAEATHRDIAWFLGEITAEDARAEERAESLAREREIAERLARIEEALGIAQDDRAAPRHPRADEG